MPCTGYVHLQLGRAPNFPRRSGTAKRCSGVGRSNQSPGAVGQSEPLSGRTGGGRDGPPFRRADIRLKAAPRQPVRVCSRVPSDWDKNDDSTSAKTNGGPLPPLAVESAQTPQVLQGVPRGNRPVFEIQKREREARTPSYCQEATLPHVKFKCDSTVDRRTRLYTFLIRAFSAGDLGPGRCIVNCDRLHRLQIGPRFLAEAAKSLTTAINQAKPLHCSRRLSGAFSLPRGHQAPFLSTAFDGN